MDAVSYDRSEHVDALDERIIHCLQVAGRAPFAVISEVLGVSEQTVSRRYRRLHGAGLIRVVGLVNPVPMGQTAWGVRLRCRPSATLEIARALARRDDVSWVSIAAGGTEVICVLRARSDADRNALMLDQLPRTAQVHGIDAFAYLHVFRASTTNDWRLGERFLSDQDTARLVAAQPAYDGRLDSLSPEDEALVQVLGSDGRASYARLAAATGWSEGRVARRLAQLIGAGLIYLDVDLVMPRLGMTTSALLSLSVEPAHLAAIGEAMARHDQVVFVGATTGRSNLGVNVVCRSADELYRFVTADLGSQTGVSHVETTLIATTLKQAGSALEDGRLALPVSRR
ncbi:Lrp/AsnC family transcriptional regulator [Luteipulveratus halotolerans]|uniref:HTH asnC-type domain-containing protein n=1 Tax=Luteipulveratus halotolerans TaxID=1631356 RepID=A0A0L6CF47_9MICO|nr:Lrp/AsnC family transcriptional regulator [Luteipulveratus halotolerans]KNX36471.1 hypothetical protein VV01_03790 [Luteipulveratus halotolerans]